MRKNAFPLLRIRLKLSGRLASAASQAARPDWYSVLRLWILFIVFVYIANLHMRVDDVIVALVVAAPMKRFSSRPRSPRGTP